MQKFTKLLAVETNKHNLDVEISSIIDEKSTGIIDEKSTGTISSRNLLVQLDVKFSKHNLDVKVY